MAETETRAKHLQWCKDRAMEYLDAGDVTNAFTSFASDMTKHEQTAIEPGHPLMMLGMMNAVSGNRADMKNWILGWN